MCDLLKLQVCPSYICNSKGWILKSSFVTIQNCIYLFICFFILSYFTSLISRQRTVLPWGPGNDIEIKQNEVANLSTQIIIILFLSHHCSEIVKYSYLFP